MTEHKIECPQSPTGKHDINYNGFSSSTCAIGPNSGYDGVYCSWCGLTGSRHWKEEYARRKGKGPYDKALKKTITDVRWNG